MSAAGLLFGSEGTACLAPAMTHPPGDVRAAVR
jgi:hypothetical protein